MRPPEEVRRSLVDQWLTLAEDDFVAARKFAADESVHARIVGFHAQQAAEKFLKAFLTEYLVEFPKTHNLGELLDLVWRVDQALAASLRPAAVLNPFGVDFRYPSEIPAGDIPGAHEAIELAAMVRDAITTELKRVGET